MLEHHLKSAVTQQRLRSGPPTITSTTLPIGCIATTVDQSRSIQRSVRLPVGRIGCERRGSPRRTCSKGLHPARRNSRRSAACVTTAAPMTIR
jgi:hypothetical protein